MMNFIVTAAVAIMLIDYISTKRKISILEHKIEDLKK